MNIPKTIKQATGRLAALDGVVTASEWERAAIVYAFTDPVTGDQKTVDRTDHRLSLEKFAEIGIAGLRSRTTVRMYRDAWKAAMKDGSPDIKPGDAFVMPVTKWPATQQGSASLPTLRKELIDDPAKAVGKIIKGTDGNVSASIVEALADGVAHVPETKEAVVAAIMKIPVPTHTRAASQPHVVTNWNVELWAHLNGVMDALKALRADAFTLDSFNSQMLLLLSHVLPEALAEPTGEADIFAEIDEFLKEKGARS